jgi:hypothetical protein
LTWAQEAAEKTELIQMKLTTRNRWVLFGGWIILSSLFFLHPLTLLARVDLRNDDLSYLIFVPLIGAAILSIERQRVIPPFSRDGVVGGGLLLTAAGVALASRFGGITTATDLQLSGYMLSLVLFWAAGFALLFGRAAVKACQFPLLFLLLLIPPPNSLLDRVIYLLQAGSAWITGALFDLLGVPALREGFVFRLARVRSCEGVQRHSFEHGASDSGPPSSSFRSAKALEKGALPGLRTFHDGLEEWNTHRHAESLSDVRRSKFFDWDTSPCRRNCFLPAGLTLVAACSLTAAAR